jgi:transposase
MALVTRPDRAAISRYFPDNSWIEANRSQIPSLRRPKLDPFTDIIERILEEDRTSHRKQRHTAKRIFDRLCAEHGFEGSYTIVKDYVREYRRRRREMFVPLAHPAGHAQADFGEADVIIAGVKRRAHFFAMELPHSDACFVAAYPAATTEAWLDGHNRAFAFLGGVPRSILYDNDKCLVSRILPDGTRQRTRAIWMRPERNGR